MSLLIWHLFIFFGIPALALRAELYPSGLNWATTAYGLSVLFEATLSRSCDVNFGAKVGIRNLVVLFYFSGVIEKCNL